MLSHNKWCLAMYSSLSNNLKKKTCSFVMSVEKVIIIVIFSSTTSVTATEVKILWWRKVPIFYAELSFITPSDTYAKCPRQNFWREFKKNVFKRFIQILLKNHYTHSKYRYLHLMTNIRAYMNQGVGFPYSR